jgi:hypothetical protein
MLKGARQHSDASGDESAASPVTAPPPATATATATATAPSAATLVITPTPFTSLARKLSITHGRPRRERLCTFVVFALLPTVLFWIYFTVSVWPHLTAAYAGLRVAGPITSLWITFGPLLMQQGEFQLEHLVRELNADGPDAGWDFTGIQHALNRAGRMYSWITIPLTLVSGLAIGLAYPTLRAAIPLSRWSELGGIFDLLITGLTSASGIWAMYAAVSITRAATRHTTVTWRPFRSERQSSLVQLYTFVWRLGAIPGGIVLTFVILLFLGGLILFSVPATMLYQMAQQQQARALDELAPLIEDNISKLTKPGQHPPLTSMNVRYTLETAFQVRAAIAAESPAPVFNLIARAATTLVLPVVLTIIQTATTFIK